MDEVAELRARLETLRRRFRWLLAGLGAVAIGLVAVAARSSGTSDVLRIRGLVVDDSTGHERVVLGAPMGEVSSDAKLDEAVGIAVKDTAGRLNAVLGARNPVILPGGERGERVLPGTGLTVYDPRTGAERGGMGALEDGRVNVCIDYAAAPKEAACMQVAPKDRYAAVTLNGGPDEDVYDRAAMYVGADGSGSIKVFGGKAARSGVMIRAGESGERLPSLTVYDSAHNAVSDLVGRR